MLSISFRGNLQVLQESFSIICEMSQIMMAHCQKTRERFGSMEEAPVWASNAQSQPTSSSRTHCKHVDAGSTSSLDPQTYVLTLATAAVTRHHATKEHRHVPRGRIPITPWFFCSPSYLLLSWHRCLSLLLCWGVWGGVGVPQPLLVQIQMVLK